MVPDSHFPEAISQNTSKISSLLFYPSITLKVSFLDSVKLVTMSGLVLLLLHRSRKGGGSVMSFLSLSPENWLAVIEFLAGGVVIVVVAVVELAPVSAAPLPHVLVIKEPGEALVVAVA